MGSNRHNTDPGITVFSGAVITLLEGTFILTA